MGESRQGLVFLTKRQLGFGDQGEWIIPCEIGERAPSLLSPPLKTADGAFCRRAVYFCSRGMVCRYRMSCSFPGTDLSNRLVALFLPRLVAYAIRGFSWQSILCT